MRYGILGKGFGLYGYLPALIAYDNLRNEKINLPIKYREFISKRKDLNKYIDKIEWYKNDEDVLNSSQFIILARNPDSNVNIIYDFTSILKNKNIIIEKPLACNPNQANDLLNYLVNNNIGFRIGYLFKYCFWFNELHRFVNHKKYESGIISIQWNFLAHHYANKIDNWKKYNSQGGGVLRFYGIHLIIILVELEFNKLLYSEILMDGPDEFIGWYASFKNDFDKKIEISVDVRSDKKSGFEIYGSSSSQNLKIKKNNPFESADDNIEYYNNDIRYLKIISLINSFNCDNFETYDIYVKTNQMWAQIEVMSDYKHIL